MYTRDTVHDTLSIGADVAAQATPTDFGSGVWDPMILFGYGNGVSRYFGRLYNLALFPDMQGGDFLNRVALSKMKAVWFG